METLNIDVAVLLVGGGPVEGVVAETINLDFVGPNIGVECFEVILVDQAKLRCCQYEIKCLKVCDLLTSPWM